MKQIDTMYFSKKIINNFSKKYRINLVKNIKSN